MVRNVIKANFQTMSYSMLIKDDWFPTTSDLIWVPCQVTEKGFTEFFSCGLIHSLSQGVWQSSPQPPRLESALSAVNALSALASSDLSQPSGKLRQPRQHESLGLDTSGWALMAANRQTVGRIETGHVSYVNEWKGKPLTIFRGKCDGKP